MAMPKPTPQRPRKPGLNRSSRSGVFGHPESQAGPLPRVGLYARVSAPHQKTIEMQLRQLRDYLERRRWREELVIEEVGSGAKRLPARDRLLDAARRREIDIIAVWRLDRWGRSLSDLVMTLQELQELDVAFVSLTEAFDLTTSTGRAMAAMVAVFAEFEREIRSERVRAGIEQARQEGRRLGRPQSASLQADAVRKLASEGLSKSEIARRLSIGRTSVRRILLDEP